MPRASIVLGAIVIATGFVAPGALRAAKLAKGSEPPSITLKGDKGGRVDGAPWSSDMLKGKVWLLFYVDPDEKDANEAMEKALDERDFPKEKVGSVGVINMEATWLPNALIASALEDKQENFPQTVYVKDKGKVLVKKWGLADDAYVTLVFAPNGKLIFRKQGTLDEKQTGRLIRVIEEHFPEGATAGDTEKTKASEKDSPSAKTGKKASPSATQ